jgi:diguanylate cyclase (GGDEF)-like protein
MKAASNIYVRIAISLGTLGLYILTFFILYPVIGSAAAALVIIPIVVAGWFLQVRGAVLAGFLTYLLNNFFFIAVKDPVAGNFLPNTFVGFAFTLIGVGVGWSSGLVERVNKQAQELRDERRILQEEMEKRIKAEERLVHEALHDPLTNLPNRRLFISRLEHASEWNKRYPNDLFAVIYLDFDRFKVINDSLGHNVGDQLLIELARRIKSSIRAVDTVARMGGDEFGILLEAVKSDKEVLMIINRIQRNISAPFEVHGNTIAMTASIGVVMNLSPYKQIDDIIRDADIAMYNAKLNGKNDFKVFDVSMRKEAEVVLKRESDLRNAICNGEFRIHYQPILSLQTKQVSGFEALVRWQHPERGLLYPADFIKAAEESKLIVPIGQWVLYEACRQMKQWQTQFQFEPALTISINLSTQQFVQPDLIQQIEEMLEETGLPASSLLLELTEMTLIDDMQTALLKTECLRKLGVGVEIDDFGTGYSSLGYLRNLPVNNLKIDRSFISTLGTNKSAVPIVRAIIAMANSLGMKVIAEGVETEEQMINLVELECDYGQGFFFNRPIDSTAAFELIKETFLQQEN